MISRGPIGIPENWKILTSGCWGVLLMCGEIHFRLHQEWKVHKKERLLHNEIIRSMVFMVAIQCSKQIPIKHPTCHTPQHIALLDVELQ